MFFEADVILKVYFVDFGINSHDFLKNFKNYLNDDERTTDSGDKHFVANIHVK